MFERVVFDKKINMKGDEELERLLDEIPHATTSHHLHHHHHHHLHHQQQQQHHINNDIHGGHGHGMYGLYDDYDDPSRHHYKYTCASPVSGFSLQSGGSSSSLLSNGHSSLSDNGPPTPPPPLEELKSQMPYYPNGLWLNSITPDSPVRNKSNESLIDELGLCRNLSTMYITNEQEDLSLEPNRLNLHDQINIEKYGAYGNMRRRFSDYGGFQSSVPRSDMSTELLGMQQECEMSDLLGMRVSPYRSDALFSQLNGYNSPVSSPWQKTKEQTGNFCQRGGLVRNLNTPLSRLSIADALFYTQRNEINWNEERGVLNLPNSPQLNHPSPHLSLENMLHCGLPLSNGRTRVPSNMNIQQRGLEAFTSEDSFIISGEGLNYMVNKELHHSRGQNIGTHDIGASKCLERKSQLNGQHQIADICGNARSSKLSCPSSLPPKYNSLAEARGNIYLIAKDQYGCRFLQRMFDEGTRQDVQIIFNEIIEHVVELMVNPFGNYLMQKLLEVCNEEQRMQILVMVTLKPGELVRISLDSHGTRVVQKLIETLKTRQQICLAISALKPGFLALIKDLNGNHVVQRCLQCLSNEDNKFIFVAAAKYCVDIATHQHGCCVLQRCISHSNGEYREKLVAEISANGLLLAQDAYGNYVIQFILELKIPSAHFNLISQFEGNYVHLSTQKFSSHVVEKCLLVFNDESRSRIIHELLSASHFEQLLQDPHANYVVQTALRVSEGPLHNSLVETIETHKAISRNSPYSKRIFSQKLLKK